MTGFTDWDIAAGVKSRRRRQRLVVRVLIAAVVLGAGIVGVAVWAVRTLPAVAAAQISRLTNADVQMGACRFHLDGSVSIDGLVLRPKQQEVSYDNAVLRARSVSARFTRGSLLRRAPRATEIRVEDFLLDAQWDLDTGQWNVGALKLNLPKGNGGPLPTLSLRGGKLRYCKVSGGKIEVVTSMPVEARFGADERTRLGYAFDIKTSTLSSGHGESRLTGTWRPGEVTLAGGLASTDIPSLARVWAVDVLAAELKYTPSLDFTFGLHLKDVHGKQVPEVDVLQFIMPAPDGRAGPVRALQKFFARFRPTGTVGSIDIRAAGSLRRLPASEITGQLVCQDISICDATFPYTIDHLTGALDFTQSGVVVNGLTGKHGDADVRVEGWTKGSGREMQYQYRVSAENMTLDAALYAALRPEQKRMWDAFQPAGVVAADYRLSRAAPDDKRMSISVRLNGVRAAYRRFPYPLTDLHGTLYCDRENIIATDLVCREGGKQIRLDGRVTGRDTGRPVYRISIDANNIPLDPALRDALPPPHREQYRRFNASGFVDVQARVFNTPDVNGVGPVSFLAEVRQHEGTLIPQQLPFPVTDVTAEAAVTPDTLTIKTLHGSYDGSRVSLGGGIRFAKDDQPQEYHLKITAEDASLNDQMIGLLPAPLAHQVAAFRPQGNVNVAVELHRTDSNAPPARTIVVECRGDRISHQKFAYPLEEVRGTIVATNDRVTFKGITAKPAGAAEQAGTPAVQLDGALRLTKDGWESGTFAVHAHDMLLTRELEETLPKSLAAAAHDLSLQGPVDLDVPTLKVSRLNEKDKLVEFNGAADFKSCRLNLPGTGTELCGVLQVDASYRTDQGFSEGRARLDAERLVIRGKPLTHLQIDARYDPNTQKWSARDFVGDCCGGKVLGNLEVTRTERGALEYLLRAALHRVDLQRFLAAGKPEAMAKHSSTGVMNASLSLSARLGDNSSRRGVCSVEITDMQVGKVSSLANLLSVLSLNEPTDYTFERMLVDAFIIRDQLIIRTFDMSGRNVAFTGSGGMDLPDEQVNLILTARGRRDERAEPSVLQSLTEGLGGGVVRMTVTGRPDDLHIETQTLPVLGDSLRVLGTAE
jgi:hypothetical protein